MLFYRKLLGAGFAVHKVRAALTIAAVALSVSLVVSVTSGYTSAEAAAHRMLSLFMGTADAQLVPTDNSHGLIDSSVIDDLRADPDVSRVTARLEVETGMLDKSGKPLLGRAATVTGLDRPDDTRVENLNIRSGQWFDSADGDEAVVDQVAAEKLDVKLGDTFAIPGTNGQLKLRVVGVVQKPAILAAHIQSVYVPLHTLQKFSLGENARQVNRVMLDLKPSSDKDAFAARWGPKLLAERTPLKLKFTRDKRKEFDRNMEAFHVMSYLGGTVSMLAATFIVFSALSMGVTERSRTLAMLRAIGAVRWQIGVLVVIEGVALAAAGAALGVPLGWVWVKCLALKFPNVFTAGVVLSKGGVLYGSAGSILSAIVASLLPAWSATRVDPLTALSPQATPPSSKLPVAAAIVGLLLVLIDPAVILAPWQSWFGPLATHFQHDPVQLSREIKFYAHFALGLPGLFFGFFLLAPAFVWTIEKLAGPLVAAIFGLRFSILRQQLSSGIWRAAGTCAALMVGLAILVAMEIQGHTLLGGWKIPDKFPDIFMVNWSPSGLNAEQTEKLKHIKGIKPGEIMPIAIASPELGGGLWAMAGAAIMPDATMFFGIEPELGMQMMQLEFRQGNVADATRMLKLGRHVIVTEEFYNIKGLTVGDKLPLKTIHGLVDYTIAGVVWSPGIDVIVGAFDMGRQFDQRTAASIFGSIDDARTDFGVTGIHLFAANLDYFTDKDKVMKAVQDEVGQSGMMAGDVRQIKYGIQQAFYNLLMLVTLVPMAALAVSSLGVTNTVMASVRTRRWQFGVLRSIGFTRSQLLRLVLAEATLIGLVGCGLGLAAGLTLAVDANQLGVAITGYKPQLVIPWFILIGGMSAVVAISILASLWPAISTSRTEPLALLQAGRSAA